MKLYHSTNPACSLIPRRTWQENAKIVLNPLRKKQISTRLFSSEVVAKVGLPLWRDMGKIFQNEVTPSAFRYVSRRGIRDYSDALFGDIPLWLSLKIRLEETVVGKMIQRLPPGAVVSDWGGGVGIFGLETKTLRPDSRVFVIDLYPPEEHTPDYTLSDHEETILMKRLRAHVEFITGDALKVTLPANTRAHFMISVALSDYLPDPLRLLVHLYNQVRPGGILVMTTPSYIYNVNQKRDWPHREWIFRSLAADMGRQGVEVETAQNELTLVMRRPDERRMIQTARFVEGHSLPSQPLFHESFYEPNGQFGQGRWVGLQPV